MIRATAVAVVFFAAFSIRVDGQAQAVAPDQKYLFVKANNLPALGKKVIAAGNEGYGVEIVARFADSPIMIMKRDGAGPRTYRTVKTARLITFVKELNEAGSLGFRVVPASVLGPFAVLEQQRAGMRFKYATAEGIEEAAKATADARKRGLTLVAVLGVGGMGPTFKPVVLFEEVEGASAAPGGPDDRDYRFVATGKTSTLEKEIIQAAADGFRVIAAGIMSVVMERDPASSATPVDYRVAAMLRVNTAERELQAAGAEGFRIVVVPDHQKEGVFVLSRRSGTSERFEYQIVRVKATTANEVLLRAEAAGFRVVVLFDDLVVFERAAA
jgi:hypothetical protein